MGHHTVVQIQQQQSSKSSTASNSGQASPNKASFASIAHRLSQPWISLPPLLIQSNSNTTVNTPLNRSRKSSIVERNTISTPNFLSPAGNHDHGPTASISNVVTLHTEGRRSIMHNFEAFTDPNELMSPYSPSTPEMETKTIENGNKSSPMRTYSAPYKHLPHPQNTVTVDTEGNVTNNIVQAWASESEASTIISSTHSPAKAASRSFLTFSVTGLLQRVRSCHPNWKPELYSIIISTGCLIGIVCGLVFGISSEISYKDELLVTVIPGTHILVWICIYFGFLRNRTTPPLVSRRLNPSEASTGISETSEGQTKYKAFTRFKSFPPFDPPDEINEPSDNAVAAEHSGEHAQQSDDVLADMEAGHLRQSKLLRPIRGANNSSTITDNCKTDPETLTHASGANTDNDDTENDEHAKDTVRHSSMKTDRLLDRSEEDDRQSVVIAVSTRSSMSMLNGKNEGLDILRTSSQSVNEVETKRDSQGGHKHRPSIAYPSTTPNSARISPLLAELQGAAANESETSKSSLLNAPKAGGAHSMQADTISTSSNPYEQPLVDQLDLQELKTKPQPTSAPNSSENRVTLEILLSSMVGTSYFLSFLKREVTSENLLFVQRVSEFIRNVRLSSQEIIDEFISEEGEHQVNIDHNLREQIMNAQSNDQITLQIFARAHNEIMELMRVNSLPRFVDSELYSQYLKAKSKESISPTSRRKLKDKANRKDLTTKELKESKEKLRRVVKRISHTPQPVFPLPPITPSSPKIKSAKPSVINQKGMASALAIISRKPPSIITTMSKTSSKSTNPSPTGARKR